MTTTARRVGLVGATGIGVGSMLGAGVFSDMWVDVLAVDEWFLLAIAAAGLVALANALSTAQLAARYPVAGGAYTYGREELGPLWRHLAGAAFVVGKTVSVAFAGVVLGVYVLPGHAQAVACAAIALAWALNARGITKTAGGATVIAVVVSVALAALVVVSLTTSTASFGWFAYAGMPLDPPVAGWAPPFLIAVAAAFFAFAGYARIATLGEEVRDPVRTIPRAIVIALAVVVALYLGVGLALHRFFGSVPEGGIAAVDAPEGGEVVPPLHGAPLESLAFVVGVPVWIVAVVAGLSVFGAMLAVMAGAGRTAMAMARERDLPAWFAHQGESGAPWRAEAAVAVVAVALVWAPGVNLLLVSVVSILTYYGVANVAAIRQRRAGRTATLRVPVWVSGTGLLACAVLVLVAAPAATGSWLALAVLALAVVGWPVTAWVARRSRGTRAQ
ncbi:MAG: APC family permease [Candidatus Cloacimonetes bacterium]|nr:APC family permease [Candidatus Cloacimonadota bacterium]